MSESMLIFECPFSMLTDCVDSDKREYLPTGITEMFSSLDFIERGYSLCILGESDAGKSYLAIAIVNLLNNLRPNEPPVRRK